MEGGIKQTYYEILGVAVDSSAEQIRRAYHKLAMRWHPDRWTKDPFRSGEAKGRFQQIQEAYSVLSDERKRSLYDVGLYDSGEDEEKQYSLEELQTMVDDMVYEFQSEPLFQNQSMGMNFDLNQPADWHSQMSLPLSSFEFYPQSSY
ncbi:DNAJ heat shock N-terminal domain-containing protein [Arabidopsis lyrata subsp. lyrata]|uniref:DNAJ heat shock N-terminal domain-containing protein n=1 Tax=Arabidopsis lyrata subsp. lyrata TaxID=81972 RepID=D7KYH5_ARALL|nr:DNAJ heat shock N-terminal domain-containing protein [Arabidopsis lyrata subsp. lyrata]